MNPPTSLRLARQTVGLTQAELAQRAHCAQTYVSLLERGLTPTPRSNVRERLTAAIEAARVEAGLADAA